MTVHIGAGVYRHEDGSTTMVGSDGIERPMAGFDGIERPMAQNKRYLVDPPGGWQNGTKREFDTFKEAEEYAGIECPARTRIVDRLPWLGADVGRPEVPVNPPNPKQRYGNLKVPLGLVPSSSTIYEALALAEGARKYGPYNWRDMAVEAMTYVHAAMRHLHCWVDGEEIDGESGKPHLGHAKACLGILIDAIEVGNLIDNRPLPAATGDLLREWMGLPPVEGSGEEVPATSWPYPQDPCPLDGRNCPPVHDHYPFANHRTMAEVIVDEMRYASAFGEGDETTADKPALRRNPIVRNPVDYRAGDNRKHACICGKDRCQVENGWAVGNNVFCCKGEAGE